MPNHPIEEISGYRGKFGIVGHTGNQTAKVSSCGCLVYLQYETDLLNEGNYYSASSVVALNGQISWLTINSGTTIQYHRSFEIMSDVGGQIDIFNNVNIGTFNKGTRFYAISDNRILAGTSSMEFYEMPTGLVGTGNIVFKSRVGAGGLQKTGGAFDRGELIHEYNGTYFYRFTPDATAKVSCHFNIYQIPV